MLLAVLTNSIGAILPPGNEVIYSNAFAGLDADLIYSNSLAGMEQDVVLRQQPPDPGSLGLNPAGTRLQMITEFAPSAPPSVTAATVPTAIGDLEDDNISFSSMHMIRGKAFLLGGNSPPAGVEKRWLTVNGRQFLIEEVPLVSIAQAINNLPPYMAGRDGSLSRPQIAGRAADSASPPLLVQGRASLPEPGRAGLPAGLDARQRVPAGFKVPMRGSKIVKIPGKPWALLPPALRRRRSLGRMFPLVAGRAGLLAGLDARQRVPAKSKAGRMRLAQAAPPGRGLVLDYMIFSGASNYVFQGDTTYEITNAVHLFSGTFTFEGGAVLKYVAGASLDFIGSGRSKPQILWLGSAYRPVIFTAKDDNSVGEPIGSGSPSGYYANPALTLGAIPNFSIGSLRIAYAQLGLDIFGDGGMVTNAQFVNCQQGIEAQDLAQAPIWVENALFAHVPTNFSSLAEVTLAVENSTFADSAYLETGQSEYDTNYASFFLTNCILAGVATISGSYYDTYSGDHNGFYNSSSFGAGVISCSQNPFQTAGGGNYYLNTDANGGGKFLGVGTTNIDPVLLTNLQTQTTRPPNTNYIGQTISTNNFTSLVARDSESPGPDLGWHYQPLDYVFQNSTVNTNLSFLPGMAVGWQGLGLTNSGGYAINFDGIVASNCFFVRCNTVQESDQSGDGTGIAGSAEYLLSRTLNATFTRFSTVGDIATFFDSLWAGNVANCEFWDGALGGSGTGGLDLYCTNCLFDRGTLDFPVPIGGINSVLLAQNCTVHGGSLTLDNSTDSTYAQVDDSAFDGTAIGVTGATNGYFFCTNNAYLTNANTLPDGLTNLFVTNFNWQTGPRGHFYLPHDPGAQDGTKLIDAGDQPATNLFVTVDGSWGAGEPLATFTTQTNQTADTNTVDIGYHYPIRFPEPPVLVSGNYASSSVGILTYQFSDGALVTNFIPQSAGSDYYSVYGRGLAVYNTNFYYTEYVQAPISLLTIRDDIHICSYGTNGSGSTNNSGTTTNRDSRVDASGNEADIAGLAFHYDTNTGKTELYALSGYIMFTSGGITNHAEVWEIDPTNGTVVAGPTNILTPVADPALAQQGYVSYSSSDGFAVLTNGDFLLNDYDGADGNPIYREYYGFNAPAGKTPGALVPGGLQFDLSIFGLYHGTGVTLSPDGKSFYFITGASENTGAYQTLVQTDLSGNLLGTQPVNTNGVESIAVVPR